MLRHTNRQGWAEQSTDREVQGRPAEEGKSRGKVTVITHANKASQGLKLQSLAMKDNLDDLT